MDKLFKEILKELKAIRKEVSRTRQDIKEDTKIALLNQDDEDYVLYITDEGMSKYGSN